ncbi:hypothetical protein EMCG_04033 [[Emmonsia] crescens]|uniref:Mitochondrial intermembrane space import and assembly protein 40 n=1 Tax=[Emmonsia] crescens TaxID=73230 RepID=A0A0G2J7W5_9EURO|nr:hypothetical protein EMCG_04033 [Emmonsia crescens UAMH 3008]
MFRPASRSFVRAASSTSRHIRLAQGRRLISTDSTSSSRKPSSWKGAALRWGLAAGVVYYYNTSTVFAEEPGFSFQPPPSATKENEDDASLPTLDSIRAAKKAKATSKPSDTTHPSSPSSSTEISDLSAAADVEIAPRETHSSLLTPGELEEEAGSEGAFNPETGEINWDCPCLGGMAHGPCGEEFRAAFSCFVHSTEEPKGMDCIDKFEGMQTCFRQHPEIYPTETDEEEVDAQLAEVSAAESSSSSEETTPEAPYSTPNPSEKLGEKSAAATSAPFKEETKASTTS